MNRKLKVAFSVIAIASLLGAVYAAIKLQRPVGNQVHVIGVWDFNLYDSMACETPITSINWGDLSRGQSKVGYQYYAKNLGQDPIYVKWTADEQALGLTLTCVWGLPPEEPPATPWARNTYIGPFSATGSFNFKITFTLTVSSTAPAGDLSFTITFSGSDNGVD